MRDEEVESIMLNLERIATGIEELSDTMKEIRAALNQVIDDPDDAIRSKVLR